MPRAVRARLASLGDETSDLTLAGGYVTLGLVQIWLGRTSDALENATQGLDHARRADDHDFTHKALHVAGMAKMHGPTPWNEVLAHIDTIEALGLPTSGMRANAVAAQGRFEESRLLFDELVRGLMERGARVSALGQAIGRGWFEMLAGELERGLEVLGPAWVELGEIGERGVRSTVGGVYADLLARAGRPDEAERVLDVVGEIGSPGDFLTASQAAGARAMAASARGEHDRAVELAREAVEIADGREYLAQRHDMWMELGEVLLAAGRTAEARDALAHARELAARKWTTAVVDRIDALLATR
jgi:tetratricopeptide (TPR) repeat protein